MDRKKIFVTIAAISRKRHAARVLDGPNRPADAAYRWVRSARSARASPDLRTGSRCGERRDSLFAISRAESRARAASSDSIATIGRAPGPSKPAEELR